MTAHETPMLHVSGRNALKQLELWMRPLQIGQCAWTPTSVKRGFWGDPPMLRPGWASIPAPETSPAKLSGEAVTLSRAPKLSSDAVGHQGAS